MIPHDPLRRDSPGAAASGPGRLSVPSSGAGPTVAPSRIRSVDALRGFDMLWILGAGPIVRALEKMSDNPATRVLSQQLKHVQWEGFVFYDLIFPLFLFLVGVSIVFSLDRQLASGGRAAALTRIAWRSGLLYLLGIFHSGGLSQRWPDIALGGVLHRIAACYCCAAVLYVWLGSRPRVIAAVAAGLLVGYWALMTFVPFPDLKLEKPAVEAIARRIGTSDPAAIAREVPKRISGVYEEGRNLANYLDFRFLPGRKMSVYYINEGLLSTLPAIALCLFGIGAGRLLAGDASGGRKVGILLAAGAVAVLLGCLWGQQFPIIKRIWSSSFILVATGCSAALLAIFFLVIDVLKRDRWCEPFVWIGMNPITLYLSGTVVNYPAAAERLAGGDVKAFFDSLLPGLGGLIVALTSLGLVFLLAWFLHRKRIFLRV